MKQMDIQQLVLNKVQEQHDLIDFDYNRGRISLDQKNAALTYLDRLKFDLQKTLASITNN